MAGNVTIAGILTGTTAGTQYIGPFQLVPNVNGEFQVTTLNLSSGDNFIAVPAWSTFTIIVPNPNNAVAMIFKGTGSDQGVPMDPSQPWAINWPSSPPSGFVLNSASGQTVPTSIIFS